jgi:diaminopimelate epimerase
VVSLRFAKLSATGNDFILFDNRDGLLSGDESRFFQHLCQRRTGVGADGVLLIEPSSQADFRMRYFNADGFESEMCGNGARAAARYAALHGIAPPQMRFVVSDEEYVASVEGHRVRLRMRPPRDFRTNLDIVVENGLEVGGYIDTGVPHFVMFCNDLGSVDVVQVGLNYRRHSAFQPRGTNVDFVQVSGSQALRVRTYERGVEAETLACGTGVVAAVLVAEQLGRVQLPVTVDALGGRLEVSRDEDTGHPVLAGEVVYVYDGVLGDPVADLEKGDSHSPPRDGSEQIT